MRGNSALSYRLLLVCVASLIVSPAHTHVHTSPDGSTVRWYPHECCNDRDCRPVVQVRSAPNGLWMTTDNGETVLVGPQDERRRSLDTRWHVCLAKDLNGGLVLQCVFEPGNS